MRISDWSSDVCSSDLDKHNWVIGYFINKATSDDLGLAPVFLSFNNAFSVPLDNLNFLFPSTVNKSEQAEIGYFGQFTADLSGLVTEGLHFTGGFRWSRDYSKRRNVDIRATPTGAVVIGPSANQTPRSDERRVGKACVSTVRYRGLPV